MISPLQRLAAGSPAPWADLCCRSSRKVQPSHYAAGHDHRTGPQRETTARQGRLTATPHRTTGTHELENLPWS